MEVGRVQCNLSIKDTLNKGHLSNEDTVCTSLYRTTSWVPVVSTIERFHCSAEATMLLYMYGSEVFQVQYSTVGDMAAKHYLPNY